MEKTSHLYSVISVVMLFTQSMKRLRKMILASSLVDNTDHHCLGEGPAVVGHV